MNYAALDILGMGLPAQVSARLGSITQEELKKINHFKIIIILVMFELCC